jgi:hypothetical protein
MWILRVLRKDTVQRTTMLAVYPRFVRADLEETGRL